MSMIVRTGVDIVFIPRVQHLLVEYAERFTRRVYTSQEIVTCNGRASAFAVRWAAKEAIAKLLGVGIAGLGSGADAVNCLDIEIIRLPSGKPHVQLHGRASTCAQAQYLSTFEISLSHDGDYAVASAVAIGQVPAQ